MEQNIICKSELINIGDIRIYKFQFSWFLWCFIINYKSWWFTYPITAPNVDLVRRCAVGHGVAVSRSYAVNRYWQRFDFHGHIFRSISAKTSIIVAPPCPQTSVGSQSEAMHSSALDFHDTARWELWRYIKDCWLSWSFNFGWSIVTKT